MKPTTALATLRDKINTATIFPGGCWYPPQPAPAPRSGQLLWRGFERPDAEADGQLWLMRAVLYLIAPKLNESTYDTAATDPLVSAVADLFDVSNPSGFFLEITGDRVDHCRITGGGAEAFSGWYAFRVDFEIKLKRAAGSA